MLTEGWDANTVTHILGIRAFGTQLLCEQVVGRALRRASYDTDKDGMFEPEYAEVYGVPFTFLSVAGKGRIKAAKPVLTVRALPERSNLRIEFPRVVGYRYQMPTEKLTAAWDGTSVLQLSSQEVATRTQLDPIVGAVDVHDLNHLKDVRFQTVVFSVAKRTLDMLTAGDEEQEVKPWLFPQLLRITRDWIENCVFLKDGAFPQLLLFAEWGYAAAERIERAIYRGTRRGETAAAQPSTVRADRIDRRCAVRHDQDLLRDAQEPPQPDGPGLRLGGQAGRNAGVDARGGQLRQEPGPELQDPVHVRGAAGQLRARLPHPTSRCGVERLTTTC